MDAGPVKWGPMAVLAWSAAGMRAAVAARPSSLEAPSLVGILAQPLSAGWPLWAVAAVAVRLAGPAWAVHLAAWALRV